MKLSIAFLQLLPEKSLRGNLEKGSKACRREVWGCRNRRPETYGITAEKYENE